MTAAVRGRDLSVCPRTPTGRPSPSAAQAGPERLGCDRCRVWEGPLRVPPNPHGASLSLRGLGRAKGLGCNRRRVGEGPLRVPPSPHRASLSLRGPGQDRRDSGVTTAVWGKDLSMCPQAPTGRLYPSAAQAGPEGLGCSRRCVGQGPLHVPPNPNGASLSLRGPGRTRGSRV